MGTAAVRVVMVMVSPVAPSCVPVLVGPRLGGAGGSGAERERERQREPHEQAGPRAYAAEPR